MLRSKALHEGTKPVPFDLLVEMTHMAPLSAPGRSIPPYRGTSRQMVIGPREPSRFPTALGTLVSYNNSPTNACHLATSANVVRNVRISSCVAIWLHCKPKPGQVSDHVQILRTAKMRRHCSRHHQRRSDRYERQQHRREGNTGETIMPTVARASMTPISLMCSG